MRSLMVKQILLVFAFFAFLAVVIMLMVGVLFFMIFMASPAMPDYIHKKITLDRLAADEVHLRIEFDYFPETTIIDISYINDGMDHGCIVEFHAHGGNRQHLAKVSSSWTYWSGERIGHLELREAIRGSEVDQFTYTHADEQSGWVYISSEDRLLYYEYSL